jgi:hypothetical protein
VEGGGNVAPERDPQGEFTEKNILAQTQSLTKTAEEFGLEPAAAEEMLAAALARLQAVRVRRPRPHLDDKIITAWNGLMISALAKGAQVLGEPALAARAVRAAEFIQRELYEADRGVLFRSYREGRGTVEGFADDYAFLIQGLLDLYETTFEVRWLQWAAQLQTKMDELFRDESAGGYFNTGVADTSILLRLKGDYDGAEPATNSVAALNLLRLDRMLGNVGRVPSPAISSERGGGTPPTPTFQSRAEGAIEALRAQWEGTAQALPQMLVAIEFALHAPRQIVLAGTQGTADFTALARVAQAHFGPRRVLLAADGSGGQAWLSQRLPALAGMKPVAGRAAAYVCENFTCRLPVTEPEELRRLLGA